MAVISGDGIGPELWAECRQVLKYIQDNSTLTIEFSELPYSADYYLNNEIIIPEERLNEIEADFDVLFLGPLGDKRIKNAIHARKMIYYIRNHFDLLSTVTPISHYSDEITPIQKVSTNNFNFFIFRENIEGMNTHLPEEQYLDRYKKVAQDTSVYTRQNINNFTDHIFQQVENLDQNKLDLVLKKYYFPEINDLWREIFEQKSQQYDSLQTRIISHEQAEYHILNNPQMFECLVAPGIIYDSLRTLGTFLLGSYGMAFSFSPGSLPVYRILHKSVPKYKGTDHANPIGTLRAFQHMLEYFERNKSANLIKRSIADMFDKDKYPLDLGGMLGTEETIDEILTYFEKH